MRINTNEEIRELVVGGQSYDVSALSNDAIAQLANSLGVQSDAEEVYHASTQSLELMPKTGSKGALSMRELAEQIDRESEEEDLHSMFDGLNELTGEDDEDEDEDEDEYEYEYDYDYEEDDYELEEETEEERQEREYLESFAIPAHHFSSNDIKYFKQHDVDVTDLSALMSAKTQIENIDNEYKTRKVRSLFEQFNNEELNVNELIKEVSKLGRV